MEARCEQMGVGGGQVPFWVAGEGPPILLLHGAGENAADWQWVLPLLAEDYRVVAPELPGRLQSTHPEEGSTPMQFAEFLRQFLDILDMHEVVVIGNSLGGLIAMQFALDHPERVSALVLADSIGLGQEINPMIQWMVAPGVSEMGIAWSVTMPGSLSRAWMRAGLYFARPARAPDEWIDEQQSLAQQPGVLQTWVASLRMVVGPAGQQEIMLDRLPQLTMPTLVVWGDRDGVVPHFHAQRALERLPNGHLHLIPDCGHLPQVEQPQEFADAVRRFLADTVACKP